jgi:ribosomal protein L11 methyltransferase
VVDVAASEVDEASGLLWAAGADGVAEIELPGGGVRLVAGIAPADEAAAVDALEPRWRPETLDGHHDGWLDAWRPFAHPIRVGPVVVHPPWQPPPWPGLEVGTGDTVVPIDPGGAFGHGDHPTTRMVLAAVVDRVPPARRVLDVGCGSGVLSVVAARLGAEHVRAIDVDEAAVSATATNAEANGVADRVQADGTALGDVHETYELVLANVLAPTLIELGPALSARLAPGGHLVVSGMLASQVDQVIAACAPLRVVSRTQAASAVAEPWVACTLAHP